MSEASEVVVRRAIAQERLRDENARLAHTVRTDALTGVANRLAWQEELRALELDRRRSSSPAAVVMIDVDGLKRVNDELGHAAGDRLLRRCAALLAAEVRSTDLVARIGGDEFAVLLRPADESKAYAWCERLHARLAEGHDASPALGWSFGYASVPPAASLAEAVDQADRRMYEMKLARRARRR
jgi:diguanylate cyclase (GGDEF)-like protein